MPPKSAGVCDRCSSALYQREDDRPDVVRTRLGVNLKEMEALLDYYRRAGKLVEVDGGLAVEQVQEKLLAAVGRAQEVR
jgi:adenylate kinase